MKPSSYWGTPFMEPPICTISAHDMHWRSCGHLAQGKRPSTVTGSMEKNRSKFSTPRMIIGIYEKKKCTNLIRYMWNPQRLAYKSSNKAGWSQLWHFEAQTIEPSPWSASHFRMLRQEWDRSIDHLHVFEGSFSLAYPTTVHPITSYYIQ